MTGHDECVAKWVKIYKDDEWTVQAAIAGYNPPPTIGKKIPDIYATKSSTTNVIEVETDETINTDQAKEQIATFKKWADESNLRTFRLFLANSKGCTELKHS